MLIIKGAKVFTCAGKTYDCADIVVDGDKIVEVTENACYEGAEIIDARGLVAIPGIVDSHNHIGLWGEHGRMDFNERIGPSTPQVEAYYGINPKSRMFDAIKQGGVTMACIPPGSANVICGTVCIVKPVGDTVEEMVIKNPVAMKIATGGNPKGYGRQGKAPMTRMGVAAILKEELEKAKIYMKKQEEAAGDPAKMPPFDQGMEYMAMVLRKEMPLKSHAYQYDNLTILKICKEYDIYCTIDHAFGADIGAEAYADPHCLGVIYGPMGQARKLSDELRSIEVESAIKLNELGVPTAIMTDGPHECADMLLWQAGEVVRHGGDVQLAIDMLTINPAKIIGMDHRVGSLEPGKDADIALFSAVPTQDVTARCVRTIINGKTVYAE